MPAPRAASNETARVLYAGGFGYAGLRRRSKYIGAVRRDETAARAIPAMLHARKAVASSLTNPSAQEDTAARQPELSAPAGSQRDVSVGYSAEAEGGGTA